MSLYDDYDELSMEDRFADALCGCKQDPRLTVPYMAMLQPMNDFDKQGKLTQGHIRRQDGCKMT